MIDSLTVALAQGFELALVAAWRALPLFMIVLALDVILRRRIPARIQCWLWMLVMVRLLLPSSLTSPLSLAAPTDGVLAAFFSEPAADQRPGPSAGQRVVTFENGQRALVPPPSAPAAHRTAYQVVDQWTSNANSPTAAELPSRPSDAGKGIDWETLLVAAALWTWALVAAGLVLRSAVAHWSFAARLQRIDAHRDARLASAIEAACAALRLSRRPQVKIVDSLDAPAVFGIFKPVLCMPAQSPVQLSDQELGWVLRHELSHIQRHDALVLWLAHLAWALHWFNPVAWIAQSRLKARVEEAADEAATSGESATAIAEYGKLLLRFWTARSTSPGIALVGLLAILARQDLRRRITALRPWPARRATRYKLVAIPLVCLLAVAGWTDASASKPEPAPPELEHTFQAALAWTDYAADAQSDTREAASLTTFDVHAALAKLQQLQPGIDGERFLLSYLPGVVTDAQQLDQPSPAALSEATAAAITDGVLRAHLTPQLARTCRQMLRALERSGPVQISVECRILQADIAYARSFAWESSEFKRLDQDQSADSDLEQLFGNHSREYQTDDGQPAGRAIVASDATLRIGPTLTARLSEAETRQLVLHSQSDPRSNIISAPRVTLFNGMEATIQDIVRRPFVTNVEIDRQHGRGKPKPVVQIFDEGFSMRTRVEATEEGLVDLECLLKASSIEDVRVARLPIRSADDPTADVIVQVPSLHRSSVGARFRIARDTSLLIALPRSYRDEQDADKSLATFYLLTPRLLPGAEDLAAFVPAADRRPQSQAAQP